MAKHTASYRRCVSCGFLFAEEPHWLQEAYSDAITSTDMGTVSRADRNSLMTKATIDLFYRSSKTYLDYGAGYGMFVRRMRDLGYDFHAYDLHCQNMFAEQVALVSLDGKHYDLSTAFEVFEHLEDPLSVIKLLFAVADHLLITTEILPEPVPSLDAWWYFAPEHGQHISFYTLKSLRIMAKAGSRFFYTNGCNIHLFSRKPLSEYWFRKAISERNSQWIGLWRPRKSLLDHDWQSVRTQVLTKLGYQQEKGGPEEKQDKHDQQL
jgi:Methyltransferase domain